MTQRTVLTVIVLVLLVIGVLWLLADRDEITNGDIIPRQDHSITVGEQEPGNQVMIDSVSFGETGGYIGIHQRTNDQPGQVLGMSSFLAEGESRNVTIQLGQPLEPGGEYMAVLHGSPGGNDPIRDNGDLISSNFTVSDEQPEEEEEDIEVDEDAEPDETDEGVI